jgi:hypothetical protein
MHVGSSSNLIRTSDDMPTLAFMAYSAAANQAGTLLDWLFSGNFVKFPGLRIALSEGSIGWIPYFLERAEQVIDKQRFWASRRHHRRGQRDARVRPPALGLDVAGHRGDGGQVARARARGDPAQDHRRERLAGLQLHPGRPGVHRRFLTGLAKAAVTPVNLVPLTGLYLRRTAGRPARGDDDSQRGFHHPHQPVPR